MCQRVLWVAGVRMGWWGRSQTNHYDPGCQAHFSFELLQDWQYFAGMEIPTHCHSYLKQEAQVKTEFFSSYQKKGQRIESKTYKLCTKKEFCVLNFKKNCHNI